LRRSQSAVHALASSLIVTQEAERKRVAAELHDGIHQDVAIIAIDLGLLAQKLPDGDGAKEEAVRIQERVLALSDDIRNLSHRLHPAILDHLGLPAALRIYCAEFERRERIGVAYRTRNTYTRYPADAELALYRICQEALRNVKRHSGATYATVTLEDRRGGIVLSIADSGCGFDTDAASEGLGLGLLSMRERASLCGGELTIQSQPRLGTAVRAFIPLRRNGGQA
jgi:signal transduction histidine kinase